MTDKPGKIVCVGRNYSAHAKELGNDVPKEPLLFLKPPSSVIREGEAIRLPPQSKQVEFEGEIGVVIGARISHGSAAAGLAAVRGICALNDVTARDLQKSDGQWTRAKGFDTFCAVGPEVPAPADLATLVVLTRVNGVERQRGLASDMVFSIPELISYISGIMTLEPGDLVATGTPAGVGAIADGDVVEIEIPGFSKVRNPVTNTV
ncbi:MAG TPA: fumarylacetoacetate hydrolase family protein [Gemmatimonadaceae bacterium]|jgi:2-keto-4-pentenoate hydratase/2-oxohepta-3-ene-1,7-dioic acid hydratase in catechol pathway